MEAVASAVLPGMSAAQQVMNIERMPARLQRLLGDFSWGRMDRIFLGAGAH